MSLAVATVPERRRVEHVMGLPVSLALRGRHAEDALADRAWQQAMASLREADEIFSTYREDSVISRLGRGEIDLADCPPVVAEVLAIGEQARVASGGAFDVWLPGDGRRRLDPSGVVKGWAVERAAKAFDVLDDTDVCLGAGGDLVCRTRRAGSEGWRIGIEDPLAPERVIAVVPLRDGAIATSGAARRGAHITDPRTGAVPDALASVTVVGDDLTWVDIEATAAYVLGDRAVDWLSQRPNRSGMVVRPDGTTESFRSR